MAKRTRKRWYPKPGKQIHDNAYRYDAIVCRIKTLQLGWPMDVNLIRGLRDQLDVIWVKLDERSRNLIIGKWGYGRGVDLLLDPRGSKIDEL